VRFQVDPRPDETQRACRAIVQASLPRSHGDVVLVVVIAAVVIAAFVLTPTTVNKTAAIAVGGVFLTVVGSSQVALGYDTCGPTIRTHWRPTSSSSAQTECIRGAHTSMHDIRGKTSRR
jgi:hypothetical protein